MIPVDNSIAGGSPDIHHLLPDSGLHIVGEHFLPIHFQLMGVPGSTLDSVRTVRSHVHALGQCRRIVASTAGRPWWPTTPPAPPARSPRSATRLWPPCSACAADLYGLQLLAEDVEDEHHNTTRFLVLARDPHVPEVGSVPVITTFVYRVRNVSAALYKALGGFATNGVNMTKLESYQLGGTFFATQFYADVEGHPDEPGLALALEELQFFSVEVRILGTYPAHPFRDEIAEPAENRQLRPHR
jgi:prephenate dehydratase